MKTKFLIIFSVLILLFFRILPGQAQTPKYYRVDKVKTVVGEVVRINFELSYHENDFAVIYMKEKKTGSVYRVEVSPKWFYSLDLMEGSQIEVTGSYSNSNGKNMIMTRSITCQGERYLFRDKHGFPMWRGLRKGKGAGQGKGRGRTGKSSQRGQF